MAYRFSSKSQKKDAEKYCLIKFYPFTPTYFHQRGVLYMLGAATIRGRLLLEGGFCWRKNGMAASLVQSLTSWMNKNL